MPDTAEEVFRDAWSGIGRVLKEAAVGYGQIIEYPACHENIHGHLRQFIDIRDEFLSEP